MDAPNIHDFGLDDDGSGTGPVPYEGSSTSGHTSMSSPNPQKKQKIGNDEEDGSFNTISISGMLAPFTNLGIDPFDGTLKAQCRSCHKFFVVRKSQYETSRIIRHAKNCPMLNASSQEDEGDMLMDNVKINQVTLREKISAAVIKHDLPFMFVEYEGIRDLFAYCNPDVETFSQHTVASDVLKIYAAEKNRLKKMLADAPSRICLTANVWTACTYEGYICLTAQFVDVNWRLNSFILSFIEFPLPHTGFELANKVLELLNEWGIAKKIFSITLDNASNNDCMQDILRDLLCNDHSLLCDGEFFYIPCCAHILDLIVREGMKVVSIALSKIRQSVRYVKGSESVMILFEECAKLVGIEMGVHLKLDVTTRWNSTYLMLESALKYRRAFARLALRDINYSFLPSDEEWSRAEKMFDFLRPFYEITESISGSSYPTSNLHFMQVWKIECLLLNNLNNEDIVIKEMVKEMKGKFDKYWNDYSVVLALGVVLDPRMKLQLVEWCYNKVDPDSASEKVNHVKKKLNMLFEQYSKNSESVVSSSSHENAHSCSSQPVLSGLDGYDITDFFKMLDTQVVTKARKNQLEIYLDETMLEWRQFQNLDVLQYWQGNKYRFPDLTRMALDVLSIPITTVASEGAFSIGAQVLNKYRSRLLPKNVQALICARNWLHGFIPVDDVDVEKIDMNDV